MLPPRAYELVVTAITLTGLSTFVVCLRFYCRYFLIGQVRLYDYLILAALIVAWGNAAINYLQAVYGQGWHIKDWPRQPVFNEWFTLTMKLWYIFRITYFPNLCLVKYSILLFYYSIAVRRPFRIAVYITATILSIFTVINLFLAIFQCRNPADAMTAKFASGSGLKNRQCFDMSHIWLASSSFNIFSDTLILVLPIPTLIRLKMSLHKRIALVTIFSVGILAVVASAVRLYYLNYWMTSADKTYHGAPILLWSQIEINTAIITASIPTLRPLVARFIDPYLNDERTYTFAYRNSANPMTNTPNGTGTYTNITALTNATTPSSPQVLRVPWRESKQSDQEDDSWTGSGSQSSASKSMEQTRISERGTFWIESDEV